MAKIKRQKVSEVISKARKARAFAADKYATEFETERAAMNLSRGPKKGIEKIPLIGTRYPNSTERKAAKLMQNQRAAELTRSEARAKGVTNRAAKKAAAAKLNKALTGSAKKAAPKAKKK